MADHLRTELVLDAVGMAITGRRPAAGTVHHTDRGTQYTSYEFGKALRASGLLASMGRVGSAFDNAMAESVFATLKTELIYRRAWPTPTSWRWRSSPTSKASTTPAAGTPGSGTSAPANYEKLHLTQNEVSA
jgi:putative transposase